MQKKQDISARLEATKKASLTWSQVSHDKRNACISDLACELEKQTKKILQANQRDCAKLGKDHPQYDRLLLTEERISQLVQSCSVLLAIEDPLENTATEETHGLIHITKKKVPFGVIGCIYEARPNVTLDMITLARKSGNAVVLRGSRTARHTNAALIAVAHHVLSNRGHAAAIVCQYPEAKSHLPTLLKSNQYVDLMIPRGGRGLISYVKNKATMPILETGASVVHMYVDAGLKAESYEKAIACIINAKIQRPTVCNAVDTILIHSSKASAFLPLLLAACKKNNVTVHTDAADFTHEYLSLQLTVHVIASLEDAITHINTYGLHHSDAILSDDTAAIERFFAAVDSSVVYANTSTRFSDGGCFGLGSEIGISTQKLHARGPMGAEALVTYKYIVTSDWAVRG